MSDFAEHGLDSGRGIYQYLLNHGFDIADSGKHTYRLDTSDNWVKLEDMSTSFNWKQKYRKIRLNCQSEVKDKVEKGLGWEHFPNSDPGRPYSFWIENTADFDKVLDLLQGKRPQQSSWDGYKWERTLGNNHGVSVDLVLDEVTDVHMVRKEVTSQAYEIYIILDEEHVAHLPKLFDAKTKPGTGKCFIYQQCIPGQSIKDIMRTQKVIPYEYAVRCAIQITEALDGIHKKGFVHRDISPANVLIDKENNAWLIDFGISREYKENQSQDTQLWGTDGFAAPEQMGFAQTDARSDIFSLGVLLNYMITGDFPRNRKPEQSECRQIIEKATEMDPRNRYQSATEMKEALKALL